MPSPSLRNARIEVEKYGWQTIYRCQQCGTGWMLRIPPKRKPRGWWKFRGCNAER